MSEPSRMELSDTSVIFCDESHAEAWDRYLSTSSDASFYQLYGWNRINKSYFSHKVYNLAAFENGKIVGVFPLVFIKSRIFGKILCSMPFVNFGGPCANNSAIEKILLNSAIEIAKRNDVDYLEMRLTRILDEKLPSTQHKISMTLKLDEDPDEIWNNFNTKHRTNIRRVYKNNIKVRSGHKDLLNDFYYILSESWRSLGTPIYRKKYFESILDEFPNNTLIFVCYHDGNIPIAAAFNGYYKCTVEGMWAGGVDRYRKLQANYVLYWEMIKHACEQGYKSYHLGRSSLNSGGEQFKKKWKADVKQLYWQYYLNKQPSLPKLNVDNPKYQLAIKTWKKLPTKLTTLIAPLVAKNIP
jgi:FemAB-related protein (PEP-CTERM system-associated)